MGRRFPRTRLRWHDHYRYCQGWSLRKPSTGVTRVRWRSACNWQPVLTCVGEIDRRAQPICRSVRRSHPPTARSSFRLGASVFTTDARNSNMQSAFGGAHLRRLRTVPKIVRYLGHKIGSNSMRQAGGHPRPRLPPAGAVKSVPQSPWPVRLKRWFDRTPPSPETDHDHQGTLLPSVSSDKVYGSLYRPRLPRPLSRRRGLP
jgi:hypothetical protein